MSNIKIGDLADIDIKGRQFVARIDGVEQVEKGKQKEYNITPLSSNVSYFVATSRQVKAVYRKQKTK